MITILNFLSKNDFKSKPITNNYQLLLKIFEEICPTKKFFLIL